MSGSAPRRWVVLIQKSPRGPLTEGEIRELIAQNLVRFNDLAYLAPEETAGAVTEWKFLWQFPEFDRRKPKKDAPPPPPNAPPRRQMSEEEIRQKIIEALPPELLNLAPEDLTPRTGPKRTLNEETLEMRREEIASLPTHSASSRSESHALRYFLGFALIGLGLAIKLIPFPTLFSLKVSSPVVESAPEPDRPANLTLPLDRAPTAHLGMPTQRPGERVVMPKKAPPAEEVPNESGETSPPPPAAEADNAAPPAEENLQNDADSARPESGETKAEGGKTSDNANANGNGEGNAEERAPAAGEGQPNAPPAQAEPEDEVTKRARDNFLGGGGN